MTSYVTTIRFQADEIADIKAAAKRIGLPVSLYIKSSALSRTRGRDENGLSPEVVQGLRETLAEVDRGEVESFDSVEAFLANLDKHSKK